MQLKLSCLISPYLALKHKHFFKWCLYNKSFIRLKEDMNIKSKPTLSTCRHVLWWNFEVRERNDFKHNEPRLFVSVTIEDIILKLSKQEISMLKIIQQWLLPFDMHVCSGLEVSKRRILSLTLPGLHSHSTETERALYFSSIMPADNVCVVSIGLCSQA